MSVLPITTRKSSGGAKGLSRASWRRYRALVVCSAVLVVLTLVVDRPGPERHARHDTGKNLPVQDVSSDKSGHPLAHLKSLVLVACHSVYTGLQFEDLEDTSAWALLDYQKSTEGQTHSFIEHILLGVEEAAKDESALLLFSGGKTRGSAGPRTESMGYWMIAESSNWFGTGRGVRDRAFTEEHSRDSLENVMFSLCRFYELTGRYPEMITVVSYDFKEARFSDVHRAALGWPEERMRFVGTPALNEEMVAGEERTRALFEGDPYGCRGELQEKRMERDPWSIGGYSAERCPAMAPLLDMCAKEDSHRLLDGVRLPWSA